MKMKLANWLCLWRTSVRQPSSCSRNNKKALTYFSVLFLAVFRRREGTTLVSIPKEFPVIDCLKEAQGEKEEAHS